MIFHTTNITTQYGLYKKATEIYTLLQDFNVFFCVPIYTQDSRGTAIYILILNLYAVSLYQKEPDSLRATNILEKVFWQNLSVNVWTKKFSQNKIKNSSKIKS